ncbi:hypothetical protein C2E23DRAFT_886340 [Lenzites betulinus]|nr:hypothetical protein C2E23DRAFT_886340 [Lenzites betulinus]
MNSSHRPGVWSSTLCEVTVVVLSHHHPSSLRGASSINRPRTPPVFVVEWFTYRLAIVDDHALVTTGPYAVVRHPSQYTVWIPFMLGLMTTQGSAVLEAWLVYNLFIFPLVLPRLQREDDTLRPKFGYDWVQWSKTIPYKLIPGLNY